MCSAGPPRGSQLQGYPLKHWHHSPGPQATPKAALRQNKEGAPSQSSSGLGRNGKGDLDKRKGKAPQLSLVKFRTSLGLSHLDWWELLRHEGCLANAVVLWTALTALC